jgi:hypothetical protein
MRKRKIKMSVTIYAAGAMTGLSGQALWKRAKETQRVFGKFGIRVLDPVVCEKVNPKVKKLKNKMAKLREYWYRDKELIRAADVVVDLTGAAKSEGVAHEIGYGRYFLWKPIVRIYPKLGPSIAWFEDDLIVQDMEEAAYEVQRRWGSWQKRFMWRVRMLNRSFINFVVCQIKEWF